MNRTDRQRGVAAPGSTRRPARPKQRLPAHCRAPGPTDASEAERAHVLKVLLRRSGLHTVCEEARCPNLSRCFGAGTATFMLLGDVCTRTCRFCNVATGRPRPVDEGEPGRIAQAVAALGLEHVVLTSVNRDDLPHDDQGSVQFAATVRAIRDAAPEATVEVLTPDFQGRITPLERVLAARPDVYNHNVETVPRLYATVRPGARYARSLELLVRARAGSQGLSPRCASGDDVMFTKSGLMLGLGETRDEVESVLRDLRGAAVDCLTLGQYLRPTLRHLPVARYLDPEEFVDLRRTALGMGFLHVASGPLVRSSFHARNVITELRREVTGSRGSPHVPL